MDPLEGHGERGYLHKSRTSTSSNPSVVEIFGLI